MKRLLKVAAALALGWVALWILFFSPSLFLGAIAIALLIWVGVLMEQRDSAANELVGAWFTIADLEKRLRDSGDAVRGYEHKRGTW